MNEFIEKLIGRLEEEKNKAEEIYHKFLDDGNLPCLYDASDMTEAEIDEIKKVIQIVNELAEEYKTIANNDRKVLTSVERLVDFVINIRDCCSTNYCEGCPFREKGCSKEKIVEYLNKELAEEYNGGWIPCSERLPSFDGHFICTAKEVEESLELIYSSFDNSWMDEFDSEYDVVAWQPLPEPYTEGEQA